MVEKQPGAIQCSILQSSCAKVGLIALIDEATGYQYERAEHALQVKLRAFVRELRQKVAEHYGKEPVQLTLSARRAKRRNFMMTMVCLEPQRR